MATRPFYPDQVEDFQALDQLALQLAPGAPPSSSEAHDLIPDQEREAFEADGWVFQPATPELQAHVEARTLPPDVQFVAEVFVGEGHLMLATGALHVRFRPSLQPYQCEALLRELGFRVISRVPYVPNTYKVAPRAGNTIEMARRLHARDEVEWASPNFLRHAAPQSRPTDPGYSAQWQFPAIDAERAWDQTTGRGVRIAIVDWGFDLDHIDLRPLDGVVPWWGIFEHVKTPQGDWVYQFTTRRTAMSLAHLDHGTFCAGLAAARLNNGVAGVGAAPGADLLLLAIPSSGDQEPLAHALFYACRPSVQPGAPPLAAPADVLSCSINPTGTVEPLLADALTLAVTEGRCGLGVPIFWSAGNAKQPIIKTPIVAHPFTIAVGSSKPDGAGGEITSDMAFGRELDFLAPGHDLASTKPGNAFGIRYDSHTSWAAPLAAGVAALLLSHYRSLTWYQVRTCLRGSCQKIGSNQGAHTYVDGRNDAYGWGRIDARAALECHAVTPPADQRSGQPDSQSIGDA